MVLIRFRENHLPRPSAANIEINVVLAEDSRRNEEVQVTKTLSTVVSFMP